MGNQVKPWLTAIPLQPKQNNNGGRRKKNNQAKSSRKEKQKETKQPSLLPSPPFFNPKTSNTNSKRKGNGPARILSSTQANLSPTKSIYRTFRITIDCFTAIIINCTAVAGFTIHYKEEDEEERGEEEGEGGGGE